MIDPAFMAEFDSLMELSLFDQAIALSIDKLGEHPNSVYYREHLGIAFWVAGEQGLACETLTQARLLGSLNETAELILIHALVCLQQRRKASALLTEFLNRQNVSCDNLEQLASKFGKLGECSLALRICQHLVTDCPSNADAWYGIGFYQERIGVPPAHTVSAFRKAMLLSRSVCARVHLAKILAQLKDWREAYLLVHEIPIEAMRRLCWAHTVFQVALANQDYTLAEAIRRTWLVPTTSQSQFISKDNS